MVYQSFIKQGLSANQARALTAEVGRENDFNPKYLFGTHGDAANGKTNLGIFSWQGERRDQLANLLKQRGLMDDKGNVQQSQQAIDAMAEFAIGEIRNNKLYEVTKRKFLNNPNVDYTTASQLLGKNYVRWDYDGNTLGSKVKEHHTKRDRYYNLLGGNVQAAQAATNANYSHNGLRLKSDNAIGGGAAHQGTYALAHALQNQLGNNLKYFTAFNDTYHQSEAYFKKKGNRNSGLHGAGLAMDIALSDPKQSAAAVEQIRKELNSKGLKEGVDYKVIDEYANPSKGATGGHLDLRFLNAAAAEKYHTGGAGSPVAPSIADQAPSLNFSLPSQAATPQLVAQNTDIQAAPPTLGSENNQAATNPLAAWDNAVSPSKPKAQAMPTDVTEKWKIQTLNFDEPTPQTQPDPYAAQYAAGFGEFPDTSQAISDHISTLIRQIYDNA